MSETGRAQERLKAREIAEKFVEEANDLLGALGHPVITEDERARCGKAVFGYVRQRQKQPSLLPPLDAMVVAAGILELRGTSWLTQLLGEPFVNTLRRAEKRALEKIVGLEYVTRDKRYELVHLYYAESLARAGKVMLNCLRTPARVSERVATKVVEGKEERVYAVYALRKQQEPGSGEVPLDVILQIDRETGVVTEFEAAHQSPFQRGRDWTDATIESLLYLKRMYSNLYLPPEAFSSFNLKADEILCDTFTTSFKNLDKLGIGADRILTGRVVGRNLNPAELERAAALPLLLDMSGAPQEKKDALVRVRGAIFDDGTGPHYSSLESVSAITVPRAKEGAVVAPLVPHERIDRKKS